MPGRSRWNNPTMILTLMQSDASRSPQNWHLPSRVITSLRNSTRKRHRTRPQKPLRTATWPVQPVVLPAKLPSGPTDGLVPDVILRHRYRCDEPVSSRISSDTYDPGCAALCWSEPLVELT